MREVKSTYDLKIGMRILVENCPALSEKGLSEARGEVTHVSVETGNYSFICDQTKSHESAQLSQGKTWILE